RMLKLVNTRKLSCTSVTTNEGSGNCKGTATDTGPGLCLTLKIYKDGFLSGISKERNDLVFAFGGPTFPKIIYLGEIFNLTITYDAKLKTRKHYYKANMEVGWFASYISNL
ncbi:hypothetical protein HK096_006918, partial [Nowakowskiella sp. JEL0078]